MRSFLFLLAILLCGSLSGNQNKQLAIVVKNIRQRDGHKVFIGFYRPGGDFPKDKTYKGLAFEARKETEVFLADIPYGTYAIALYHDLNDNDKLDKNFLGIPKEPYGFSRNYRPLFTVPGFEDCSFVYDESHTSLEIALIQ